MLTPTRAEIEKAKAGKLGPEEMPKAVIVVLDLATGKTKEKLTGYRSFSIIGEGAGMLVLVKEPKPEPKAEAKPETAPMPRLLEKKEEKKEQREEDDQPPAKRPGMGKLPDSKEGEATTPRPASDLVIRNLADGKEVTFTEVQEHAITKDVKQIVYATSGKNKDNNGVYFAEIVAADKAQTLVTVLAVTTV